MYGASVDMYIRVYIHYTAKQQHALEYVLLSLWVVAEHGFESGEILIK